MKEIHLNILSSAAFRGYPNELNPEYPLPSPGDSISKIEPLVHEIFAKEILKQEYLPLLYIFSYPMSDQIFVFTAAGNAVISLIYMNDYILSTNDMDQDSIRQCFYSSSILSSQKLKSF